MGLALYTKLNIFLMIEVNPHTLIDGWSHNIFYNYSYSVIFALLFISALLDIKFLVSIFFFELKKKVCFIVALLHTFLVKIVILVKFVFLCEFFDLFAWRL